MLNFYEGVLDTNVVIPLGANKCKVVFEFMFDRQRVANEGQSIETSMRVSDKVQDEDLSICEDVQRGLETGTWESGRYCAKREGGAYLFHKLLARDLGLT
jgi:choline monooxygenase